MDVDLDAARAARRDLEGGTLEVRFGGETFTVPGGNDWPLDAYDALAAGRMGKALELIFGDDWERFAAHKPTLADCEAFMDACAAGAGLGDAKNSSGRSGSSTGTGATSKRRSKPATKSTSTDGGAGN